MMLTWALLLLSRPVRTVPLLYSGKSKGTGHYRRFRAAVFIVFTREDSFELIIHARFSGVIHTNEDEQYFPLTVINFA